MRTQPHARWVQHCRRDSRRQLTCSPASRAVVVPQAAVAARSGGRARWVLVAVERQVLWWQQALPKSHRNAKRAACWQHVQLPPRRLSQQQPQRGQRHRLLCSRAARAASRPATPATQYRRFLRDGPVTSVLWIEPACWGWLHLLSQAQRPRGQRCRQPLQSSCFVPHQPAAATVQPATLHWVQVSDGFRRLSGRLSVKKALYRCRIHT